MRDVVSLSLSDLLSELALSESSGVVSNGGLSSDDCLSGLLVEGLSCFVGVAN